MLLPGAGLERDRGVARAGLWGRGNGVAGAGASDRPARPWPQSECVSHTLPSGGHGGSVGTTGVRRPVSACGSPAPGAACEATPLGQVRRVCLGGARFPSAPRDLEHARPFFPSGVVSRARGGRQAQTAEWRQRSGQGPESPPAGPSKEGLPWGQLGGAHSGAGAPWTHLLSRRLSVDVTSENPTCGEVRLSEEVKGQAGLQAAKDRPLTVTCRKGSEGAWEALSTRSARRPRGSGEGRLWRGPGPQPSAASIALARGLSLRLLLRILVSGESQRLLNPLPRAPRAQPDGAPAPPSSATRGDCAPPKCHLSP